MAVTAPGSRYTRNTRLYIAAICIVGALIFAYDGWISEKYQAKERDPDTGEPTANLLINRYAPIPLAIIGLGSLALAFWGVSQKVVADENELVTASGKRIAYTSIKKIDKRNLAKAGYFILEYEENSSTKTLKLSDRQFENLNELLDEIILKTGAEPAGKNSDETA